MKLTTSTASAYPKFTTIGDSYTGKFVSYEQGVEGKFGPENILILDSPTGELSIRCPAILARTLAENARHLTPGVKVTVTYVADIPTNKGKPAKKIEVDVETGAAAPKSVVAVKTKPREVQGNLGDIDTDEIPF
jgi:hypothetical protein